MVKTYKKIDFFYCGDYLCSTNQSKTCKEAKTKLLIQLENKSHTIGGLTRLEVRVLNNPQYLKAHFCKK